MSDFNITVDDLTSNDGASIVKQQNKWIPTGGAPKSTRSVLPGGSIENASRPSTLSVSSIMQGVPLYGNVPDVIEKQQSSLANLLSTIVSDTGKVGGFFSNPLKAALDFMLPDNTKAALGLSAVADAASNADNNNPPPAGGGDITSKGFTDSKTFANNSRVQFDSTKGGQAAKKDMIAGNVSPNVIFALNMIIYNNIGVTIGTALTDEAGNYNQPPPHGNGCAADITELRDLATGRRLKIYGPDILVQRALDALGSIPVYRTAGDIGSPIDPGFGPGFYTRPDLETKIHVGFYQFANIIPIPIDDQNGLNTGAAARPSEPASKATQANPNSSPGSFVFYNQCDPKWGSHPYGDGTICSSGCGPTSVAEVVATFADPTIIPPLTAEWSMSNGGWSSGSGTSWGFLVSGPKHWGLNATNIGKDINRAMTILNNGGLVIAAGLGPPPFTYAGHILVLRGTDGSGNILVGDPDFQHTRTSYSPQEIVANGLGTLVAVTR